MTRKCKNPAYFARDLGDSEKENLEYGTHLRKEL